MKFEIKKSPEKYKKILAVVVGVICLILALFLPAKYVLGITDKTDVWSNINWIFLCLAILFLWGRIIVLAKAIQALITKIISKKIS
tara:strand:- start:3481 stop:3738 length:258 start_codon:yes stop_codon:yes gene_type:complete